jgi:hypothetical protein
MTTKTINRIELKEHLLKRQELFGSRGKTIGRVLGDFTILVEKMERITNTLLLPNTRFYASRRDANDEPIFEPATQEEKNALEKASHSSCRDEFFVEIGRKIDSSIGNYFADEFVRGARYHIRTKYIRAMEKRKKVESLAESRPTLQDLQAMLEFDLLLVPATPHFLLSLRDSPAQLFWALEYTGLNNEEILKLVENVHKNDLFSIYSLSNWFSNSLIGIKYLLSIVNPKYFDKLREEHCGKNSNWTMMLVSDAFHNDGWVFLSKSAAEKMEKAELPWC